MITYHTKTNEVIANKAVSLKNISKKYSLMKALNRNQKDNFGDFWALRNVSMDIPLGQILGIIGRNGAGKTTILNIIAGVLPATKGEVKASGKVLGLFSLGIGFQDELTGRENIFLNGTLIGATRKELECKKGPIIDFSELGNFIDMPLGAYSQGMRLRLAFSIIVNLNFDVLVIDEVLAVGDILFQSKCFERLMDFKLAGKTLVITTQDIGLVERLCDKVALLDHGSLLFYGEAGDGINRYRSLLNAEKFFVSPISKYTGFIENTKKWAEDVSDWGKKFGTKQVKIDLVKVMNKFGMERSHIKSGDTLKVKVNFIARDNIQSPHFGVAVFRSDGVYCYGPNTKFDGYKITNIGRGKGWFMLYFKKILLAPGAYRLSVAIWDKNETLAFDYHNGYYELIVRGKNPGNELLNIPFKINSRSFSGKLRLWRKKNEITPDLNFLKDKWGKAIEYEGIKVKSVKLLDACGREKSVFMTNDALKIVINIDSSTATKKKLYLWLAIYRDDGIYCQGITQSFNQTKDFEIVFPELSLLPGAYRVYLSICDKEEKLAFYRYGAYEFRIIFNQEDHGTVYLKHIWKWRLAR